MFVQVGACPQCGAPIYAPGVWHSILPPPSQHSCTCAGNGGSRSYTSTKTTFDVEDDDEALRRALKLLESRGYRVTASVTFKEPSTFYWNGGV